MSIGDNIKRRRTELKMSQQDLADMLGYKTRSSIAKIESGQNDVTHKKLEKIAEALNTTSKELILEKSDTQTPSEKTNAVLSYNRNKNIAIVLAGGNSDNNRQKIPSQFLTEQGKPIIMYCLSAYQMHNLIDDIYVVCLKGWEDIVAAFAKQYNITKLKNIIPASNSGMLSLKNAINYIKSRYSPEDIIIIQEATRPMINSEVISKLLRSCFETGSTIMCHSMNDYVQFDISGENPKYIDRNFTVALQSPEAHKLHLLNELFETAHKQKHPLTESNCTMLLYNLGYKINFLQNNINNIKITSEENMAPFSAFVRDIKI